MARLGRKALQNFEIDSRRRQEATNRKPPSSTSTPQHQHQREGALANGSSSLDLLSSAAEAAQHDQRCSTGQIPIPLDLFNMEQDTRNLASPANFEALRESTQEAGGFEDMDALFGGYLDLAFPTNFLDPLFLDEETEQMQ